MTTGKKTAENADNRDPISGEPGSHPVGVGAGTAIGGAAAGAAAGTAVGPVGTVTGAVAGGIVGAIAGKAVAERINPTEEDAYWQANYRTRPYATGQTDYNVYRPAYRYGWETRGTYPGRQFEDVEPELRAGWGSTSNMKWVDARPAVRDAWERIDLRSTTVGPGNSSIHEVRNTASE
jgi:hypothetical protein